eukprot:GFUD01067470.1.p1 GENE.GFUD01067470.1~~GFUD01067470.1.p1  ORF type:complete len:163 (-),score=32.14 GFUD01067470.1:81-569(-)
MEDPPQQWQSGRGRKLSLQETGQEKWQELKSRKDNFLSSLKNKFSRPDQQNKKSKKQKVFIPAVHAFMQPNIINQRKSSCPDNLMKTTVGLKTISRKSSLPVLNESLKPPVLRKRYHSEGSESKENYQTCELKKKIDASVRNRKSVIGAQTLQSVKENPERE